MKRKWEGITGMPLPKKLRTSEAENNNNVAQQKKTAASKTVLKKSKATKTAAAAAPPIAEMPPHPDDKINVDKMIVNDLRKELRKRQLSTSGRKAELQTRLREYLAEAKQTREAEWAAKHAAVTTTVVEEEEENVDEEEVIEETTTKIKQVKIDSGKKNVNEMDVVMEDVNEETADVSMRSVSDEAMPVVQNKKSDPPAAKSVENPSVMKKKQQLAPKSALKTSKYTSSSAGQSTPQIDDVAEKQSSKHMPSSSVKEQLIPTKISDSSVDSAAVSKSAKVQPSSVQKTKVLTSSTPSGSAFKANVGGGASGSNSKLMEKKKVLSAASEARKARLAEMRQKVRDCLFCYIVSITQVLDILSHLFILIYTNQAKPTAGVSSATKPPPSHSKYAPSSSLKKMASSSTLGENKPSSIMAKMREKAAAEKNSETSSTKAPQQPVMKSTLASKSIVSSANSIKPSQVKASQKHAMKPSPSTALKSIHDPANKPPMSQVKKASPKKVVKPLSPMQTYEMSDREEEESDSDSDSDEEYERQRPKKQVPEWAQKSNLHRALERQFADGPHRMDPDKIFGECLTCNLEQIFDKKKSRYQRRTSSGNWSKDHVTLTEKRTYKKTMGLSGV